MSHAKALLCTLVGCASRPINEPIETMKDLTEIWKRRRELLVGRARFAGVTKAQAEARVRRIDLDVLAVRFDAIPDRVWPV